MAPKQVLRGWDDDGQPTVRNLAEVLETLRGNGRDLEACRLWFEVPLSRSSPSAVARLLLSARGEDIDARFDLPLLQGVKARTTLGDPCNLPLEELDKAKVDAFGNVRLTGDKWVHAVQFDPMEVPGPWTDLDEAIVWLTIKAFKAERMFVHRHLPFADAEDERSEYRWVFIDYSVLHLLHEPNVKELTRYINVHIVDLPRASGKLPFKPVAISKVQRTLSIAGVSKVRGHSRRHAI